MGPQRTFGKILKAQRNKNGFTLRQLAEKIDYNFAYLSQLEADIAKPSEDLVKALAQVFHLTSEEEEELLFLARGIPQQIADIKQKYPHMSPAFFRKALKKKEDGT
jgi:transcriptional regulator with XRE-family HTH domain